MWGRGAPGSTLWRLIAGDADEVTRAVINSTTPQSMVDDHGTSISSQVSLVLLLVDSQQYYLLFTMISQCLTNIAGNAIMVSWYYLISHDAETDHTKGFENHPSRSGKTHFSFKAKEDAAMAGSDILLKNRSNVNFLVGTWIY